jgi:hypothetical protein
MELFAVYLIEYILVVGLVIVDQEVGSLIPPDLTPLNFLWGTK